MSYNPEIHHRRSVRLREYDYSAAGAYFVTICVQGRECLFGEIADGTVRLNVAGQMIEQCWLQLPERFSQVEVDEYVIMPNHFHGSLLQKCMQEAE
jgi:REP element-mobilizing transposase RayT